MLMWWDVFFATLYFMSDWWFQNKKDLDDNASSFALEKKFY